jgi:hypothetical protein
MEVSVSDSLVKNLVELHGGSVRAESAGPGNGATFVVALPMLAQVASDLPREHPTGRRVTLTPNTSLVAGLRLLIVDDEPETLELFKKLFAECGAEIVVAESAARALEEFEIWERRRPHSASRGRFSNARAEAGGSSRTGNGCRKCRRPYRQVTDACGQKV